jgi:hypothetical protein
MSYVKTSRLVCAIGLCAMLWPATPAHAQGVTTGAIAGTVKDPQGQVVPGATVTAIHEPSGTNYEAFTRADGRFVIPGMRVGGPYKVSASLTGFTTETKGEVSVSLGVSTDLDFTLKVANIAETITVVGVSDPVFSSTRTGAATAVTREELATLPTISGRIGDITRLTPQASGSNFAGQDNRMNNITVDGSYFNNSFGLGGQPGDRTGVAPISLEAIEQVQVNVAPFDVRQGNFVGAGVNTVTRSGTNKVTGSIYHRFRNESFVGTDAAGLPFNPGKFNTKNTGAWLGGPILKNRLFAFGSYERQEDTRPLTTFRANRGGEPIGGSTTRVLASDLTSLSSLLSQRFQYDTGPFENIDKLTPAKPFLVKLDYNANSSNKVTFRYSRLDSSTDVGLSNSSSLGIGRNSAFAANTNFLGFKNSNYTILENYRSGIGEWNSVVGSSMSNSLIVGYTTNDESRGDIGKLFPFVDILDAPGGVAYTSFGSEPFTPNNELRYKTFQMQDNFTKFSNKHSFTFGGSVEKYNSENVFFPGKQSAYVYNSLADFYTDVNGYAANPNRTTSPVTLRRFQVRYTNIPGQEKPIQPLAVWYGGGYAQDEWRPRTNVTVTAGIRVDVPVFGDTAYPNANVDALTFRDENGQAVRYSTGKLPDPKLLWSPRLGFNWDVAGDQRTQVRGGTGVFTGKPAYVWISNQIGNTGMLTGFIQDDNTTARPFNPDPNAYKPATVTGAPATSVDLAVTDPEFKFPQLWRTNIAVDRRLPWKLTATGEFIYNRDVNGVYYINANLPAAQSAFVGADARQRWTGTPCASAGQAGPCVTRINNAPGNQITNAIVLKNQNVGRSWNAAASLSRALSAGFSIKGAYSYGRAKNTVDAGSIAAGSWNGNTMHGDPNNPGLGFSTASPGHRAFIATSYTRQYFNLGATTVSAFWEARNNNNTSYLFGNDMNGDTGINDLVYIPRDTAEMNFQQFTHTNGRVFTAAEQAAAWDAYIQQDPYLRKHRGEYAERNGVFLPMVKRMDLSLTQDLFHSISGRRHAGQIRFDVTNFGNLLNHNWGVGRRLIRNQVLTNGGADAQGRATYRMVIVNNEMLTRSYETTTFPSDVYQFMISFRYTFQ